jgi:hypothetical protein
MRPNGKLKIKGCFCSFNCCKAYALKENIDHHLIGFLYKKLTGAKMGTPIKPAPSRYCLQQYGGPCTIEEFRRSSIESEGETLDIDTRLIFPQIINCNDFITKQLTRQQYLGLEALHEKMAKTTANWKNRAPPTSHINTGMKKNVEKNAKKPVTRDTNIGSDISRQHDSIGLRVIRR